MTTLATNLRNKLEKVVIEARDVAETGARAALEAMAVHHHEPYSHMNTDERKLRNRLRAHGRQLGDYYDSKKGTQVIDHLVNECAYEHWHRMLFARFLAENDLLIEPEVGVAISLLECEDLAKEQKIDPWVLASRYAQQMLPQIFRPEDPVLQVTFAREHLLKLERLLESMEPEVFTASDAIGWVYQFWQSKKKDEVNRSGKKVGADELPAVTQLFTEPYMVSFLIHNSLGAWYAGKVFAAYPELAQNAKGEEELRNTLALPGVTWDFLRFIKNENGIWQPAAGTYDSWPKKASELKVLDPCCGSGHFLVAVFLCLVALRMAEEGLSAKEASDAVLRDNIFGLEIDERCTQIAAFNIALTAWKISGYQNISTLNLACSGLAPRAKEAEWVALTRNNTRLKMGMVHLYNIFKDAPTLGSLINPRKITGNLIEAEFSELTPFLTTALESRNKQRDGFDNETDELAISAQGIAKAAEILAGQFTLVITNVPYLGRGKQDDVLMNYCERVYSDGKADLATCFIERCIEFCSPFGSVAIVTPQNWLFLGTYRKLRQRLLSKVSWEVVIRLGEHAFESSQAAGAFVSLIELSKNVSGERETFYGLDTSNISTPKEKAIALSSNIGTMFRQKDQLEQPDSRIVFAKIDSVFSKLSTVAECYQGIRTGDRERFIVYFWEVNDFETLWAPFRNSSDSREAYSGFCEAIRWENGKGHLHQYAASTRDKLHDMHESGNRCWGRLGIAINQMRKLAAYHYLGEKYDGNVNVIVPYNPTHLLPIWCFCSSPEYELAVRRLDQKLNVTNATLVKVPFDLIYWEKVAAEKYPDGLNKPFSNNPTQWLFDGNPVNSIYPLHVAVARLLGYLWPRQTGSSFQDCPALDSDNLFSFADDDGIVCIPSIRGEDAAAERLCGLLAAAYGADWSPAKERELVTASQAQDLDDWLRNQFFEQHCQLFHHRPFVWHIWDGRKRDGFHALVNYHKLAEAGGKGRQLLEKLTYGYLGDWITLQKDGVKQGIGGADDRLAAALELEKRLKTILDGQPPFDIFVRWKPIEQQPIGWEPDINDGVRLNIRPFMADDIPGGKKGAGILRWKPNIKWEKDRGKDVASAPWFNLGPQYDGHPGDRINDHHLTCEEKRKDREAMEKPKEKQT